MLLSPSERAASNLLLCTPDIIATHYGYTMVTATCCPMRSRRYVRTVEEEQPDWYAFLTAAKASGALPKAGACH